jgi:glycosyltransferase involved in cell wall biosynthesis
MIITLITPTYNSATFLNKHIESVKEQKIVNLEHIFIDNLSSDRTLEILNNYKKSVKYKVKIYSKKDRGIYYAFNKGLKLAKGEIITILNSDDFFFNKSVLSDVVKNFKKLNNDFMYGNIKVVLRNNIKKTLRKWNSEMLHDNNYFKIPHPSFFIKKKFILNNNIYFKTSFKISSDLDFMIRCVKKSKKFNHLNKVLVNQRSGGTSQKFINIFISNFEVYKILVINKIDRKLYFIFKKILYKICQF